MSHAVQMPDKLWYTRCTGPTPLGLASNLGWFIDEFRADGIGIYTLQDIDDAKLLESHYDHSLKNSFRQGGNIPAIWARSRNPNSTKVIGINWVDEYQGIVTLPGTGIKTGADLKGRRLALPKHTDPTIDHVRATALRGFLVGLETQGLGKSDVEFVDIVHQGGNPVFRLPPRPLGGYNEVYAALHSGEVDAIFVKGARGLSATHATGSHVIYDIRNHPDPLKRANNSAPRPITVDQSLLDNHPEIVRRFLTRILDISDWAAAHPAETIAYVTRETRSEDEWVRKAYGTDLHLHQGTDLNDISVAALDGYKTFLFQHGFIPADFDIQSWIDPAPLADVSRRRNIKLA